ncbi:hypothetical protein N0V90_007579 [Kalmusia sp. IMI 367209]|nr:hypothetical protein N0V90_007579 [Kalmusia sp. IMI 367209]
MSSWKKIALAKKERELEKIPEEWRLARNLIEESRKRKTIAGAFIEGLLDQETIRITRLDPVDIVNSTSNGSLSAYDVVKAFSKRAAYGHQMSLNLLEVGFDVALDRARELDRHFQKHGKPIGPLHGLPITLKDHFHVKGMETCFAYVGWIGTFEGEKSTGKERVFQSELIEELVSLGAVIIGKSSLVTTTWAPETNNNIVGYQFNPWNQLLSAGGSSGGEGSVQALRGSAMGLGSDSGGSVGMPAAYNGVYSHKPSSGRLSFKDAPASGKSNLVIPSVIGIMGPSVASLKLMFKSLQSTEPWKRDPFVHPLGYREELEYNPNKDPLPAFGVMKHDGVVRPHPPIARAMDIAEKAVQRAGLQTLPWDPPSHAEIALIHGPIARGDGVPDGWKNIQLSGEDIIPQLLGNVFPDKKLQPPMNLIDWEHRVLHLQDYRTRYNAYWESTAEHTSDKRPVEAFLIPVSATAAFLPGKFMYSRKEIDPAHHGNELIHKYSILKFCQRPGLLLGRNSDKSVDVAPKDYQPLSEKDRQVMESYDADIFDGTPAAIQIIGRRHDEERLLSVAQVVVEAIERYKATEEVNGNDKKGLLKH